MKNIFLQIDKSNINASSGTFGTLTVQNQLNIAGFHKGSLLTNANNDDSLDELNVGPPYYILHVDPVDLIPKWTNVSQLDQLTLNTLKINGTIQGDLLQIGNSNQIERIPIGTNGQILTTNGSNVSWQNLTIPDPLTINDLTVNNTATINTLNNSIGNVNQLNITSGLNILNFNKGSLLTSQDNTGNIVELNAGPPHYVLEIDQPTLIPKWTNNLILDSATLNTLKINGTSQGDLLQIGPTNNIQRVPIGASGYILTSNGSTVQWQPLVLPDPLTINDLVVNNSAQFKNITQTNGTFSINNSSLNVNNTSTITNNGTINNNGSLNNTGTINLLGGSTLTAQPGANINLLQMYTAGLSLGLSFGQLFVDPFGNVFNEQPQYKISGASIGFTSNNTPTTVDNYNLNVHNGRKYILHINYRYTNDYTDVDLAGLPSFSYVQSQSTIMRTDLSIASIGLNIQRRENGGGGQNGSNSHMYPFVASTTGFISAQLTATSYRVRGGATDSACQLSDIVWYLQPLGY